MSQCTYSSDANAEMLWRQFKSQGVGHIEEGIDEIGNKEGWSRLKPGFQLNATHATQPIAFSWKLKSVQETQ